MSDDTNKDNPAVAETSDHEQAEYKIKVFNTFTETVEEIEVSEEVYNEYRRGVWRIKKNNKKHMEHTIPFSSLIIRDGASIDDISEFADMTYAPEPLLEKHETKRAIFKLPPKERDLITALFFHGLSSREYAKKIKHSQTWIQKKKWKVLKKLEKNLS